MKVQVMILVYFIIYASYYFIMDKTKVTYKKITEQYT